MEAIDRGWHVQRVRPQSDGHSTGSATNSVSSVGYTVARVLEVRYTVSMVSSSMITVTVVSAV